MRNFAAAEENAVVDGNVAVVDAQMDVRASTVVPAGEESLKADDAILARSLNTAQPDRVLDRLAALVEG